MTRALLAIGGAEGEREEENIKRLIGWLRTTIYGESPLPTKYLCSMLYDPPYNLYQVIWHCNLRSERDGDETIYKLRSCQGETDSKALKEAIQMN